MNSEEWLQKARLRYVVETYLPDLAWAYLARRCRDNCNEQERDRVRRHPILQADDFFRFVDQRAILSYFELKPPALKPAFARVFAQIFIREFAFASGDLGERIQPATRELTEFILHGNGSPFAILHNSPFAASELSFEHQAPAVSPEEANDDQKRRAVAFLRGGRPLDWDIIRDVAIDRPIEEDLLSGIQSEQLVVLTSSAGDGKSTILKRCALALAEGGWRVLMTEPPPHRPFPSVKILGASKKPTCLLVDNADLATNFPFLESELVEAPYLRIVLCARSYQWERKRFVLSRKLTLSVPTIAGAEIDALVQRLIAWRASGRPRTRDELKTAILHSVHGEHPHLLAAMMTATHGVSFRTIIDRMIDEFEDAKEQWSLRLVACGALFEELSGGRTGRLPGPIFLRIVAKHLNPNGAAGERLSEWARARLRAFASEIITHKPPVTHAVSQYDLRHPDITYHVLNRYFGTCWGETAGDINLLEEDFHEIVSAEFAHFSTKEGRRNAVSYAVETINSYFKSKGYGQNWVSVDLIRRLTRTIIDTLGSFDHEINIKQTVLLMWAQYEDYSEQIQQTESIVNNLSDLLFEEACELDLGGEAWRQWAKAATGRGNSGSWEEPEPTSARAIYRRAWKRGVHDPAFLRDWIAFEASNGNLGDVGTPVENSARWIARWAWEAEIRAPVLIAKWIRLEIKAGNLGVIVDPDPYSVRWIFHTQVQAEERDENLFSDWFRLEENAKNVGDATNPERNTARWIARRAWDQGLVGGNLVSSWIRLEANEGNLGKPEEPNPYSARWIAREGGDAALDSEVLLSTIMVIEARDGRVGQVEAPAEWTARWYARRAWQRGIRGKQFLSAWARLELLAENLGGLPQPEPYTARWILRSAWNLGIKNSELVMLWLNLEARANNIGGYETPAPYTFRWVGRAALAGDILDAGWLAGLMKLEEELGNLGEAADPAEFSARWIGRRAWLRGARAESFLVGWVAIEALAKNLGEFDAPAEFTSRWILQTAWAERVRLNTGIALWIMIEGQNGNIGEAVAPRKFTARWIARTAWASGIRTENIISEWHAVELLAAEADQNNEHIEFTAAWISTQTGFVPASTRPVHHYAQFKPADKSET